MTTVQAVLTEEDGIVSQNMLRWAKGIARESIVLVDGITDEVDRRAPSINERDFTRVHNYWYLYNPTSDLGHLSLAYCKVW